MDDKTYTIDNLKEIGNDNLRILSDILDEIYDIFTAPYYIGEFLLNLFFVILVIIITVIIYWDSINNMVSSKSRCKRQLNIINNKNGEYLISARDKNNNRLFNISYNFSEKSTNVECDCNEGDVVNTFENIRVRNLRNNTDTTVDKTCSCEKYYDTGSGDSEILYDGEPGVIRYMNTNDNEFFINAMNI
jgi:hypothetical protein